MVRVKHGHVVTHRLVLAVPETYTRALVIYVERNSDARRGFATGFQRIAKTGELRRNSIIQPLPEIAQIADVDVISDVRGGVGVQGAEHQPRPLRPSEYGCPLAQCVPRENPADIHLA